MACSCRDGLSGESSASICRSLGEIGQSMSILSEPSIFALDRAIVLDVESEGRDIAGETERGGDRAQDILRAIGNKLDPRRSAFALGIPNELRDGAQPLFVEEEDILDPLT